MATNYYADNPINGLVNGLLQGSQIGLQMRQLQNQEEQQKIANEDKQLATAIEMFKVTKNPQMQKMIAENYLTPALINRGYLAPGQKFTYDGTPAAKNYFQIVSDANNMIEKGLWTKDQAQEHVLDETIKLKDAGESGVPSDMQGSIRKDVGPPVAETLLSQARYAPATSAAQAMLPQSIADKQTLSDPAYQPYMGEIEKYSAGLISPQDIESNKASLLSRATVLDHSAVEKYRSEKEQKPSNLNFSTFTDENGTSWRIGYDAATGEEVNRVKQGKGSKRDAFKEDAVMTRIVNSFNNNPAIRKVEQMDEFAQLIVDVAKSNNPIGHASLETLMARASGEVGNLSEADKKPFGGSRALDKKIKQYFTELYNGKKTSENIGFISQLATTFQETGNRKKISMAKEQAAQYARANRGSGITEKEILNMLVPFYEEPSSDKQNKPSPKPKTWEELKKQKGIQ